MVETTEHLATESMRTDRGVAEKRGLRKAGRSTSKGTCLVVANSAG